MITAALAAVLVSAAAPHSPDARAPLDPAPLFTEGAAAQARRAFDAERYGEAAAKLARVKEPEAVFLRARALALAGQPSAAAAALDGLAARLPDLADRIAFLRGEALEKAGRKREALAAWADVPEGSVLSGAARLARARVAAALGERRVALDALGPLLTAAAPEDLAKPDHGAAALLLAGELHAAGPPKDPEAARRVLIECYAAHPLSPESGDCLAALRALPAPYGGEPAAEAVLRRAELLLEANRNDAALGLLGRVVPELPAAAPGEALACRARSALGRAHRKERRYADAIDALRPVVEGCDDPAVRVRALFVLAGSVAATGNRDEAIALYRLLARDYPRHTYADDALFSAAELLLRAGRDLEARESLHEIARDYPGADSTNEARFRLAWLARRDGQEDAAIRQLLAIEETRRDDDPYEHGRAAYWRGRVLAARGESGAKAAQAIWADLAARYPADYYGLLARGRLAQAGEVVAVPRPDVASARTAPAWDPGPVATDPHFRAGLLLLRMGFPREATDELGAIEAARLAGTADAPEPALAVADLLDRAGDHRTAHHLLRTRARVALRRAPDGENLRAWRIAYPPAFRDHVERWAPPAGVPVELLQALMREESALDPRAVSPAGAVGLTQLMLPTAREVARQLKLPRPSRADLMNGSLNVRIGARYLGQLIRRFDGELALAIAAYNAGGGAVRRWLDERGDLDIDEFVEEIPYDETRGYVKRVLRSYAAYDLLYRTTGVALHGGLFKIAKDGG